MRSVPSAKESDHDIARSDEFGRSALRLALEHAALAKDVGEQLEGAKIPDGARGRERDDADTRARHESHGGASKKESSRGARAASFALRSGSATSIEKGSSR